MKSIQNKKKNAPCTCYVTNRTLKNFSFIQIKNMQMNQKKKQNLCIKKTSSTTKTLV